jgi:hypothetical protein
MGFSQVDGQDKMRDNRIKYQISRDSSHLGRGREMPQQWEYCELRWQVSARYEMARPEVVFYRDPSRPWSLPDVGVEALAKRLGLEGWELVSVISFVGIGASSGPEIHYYFKRPLGVKG